MKKICLFIIFLTVLTGCVKGDINIEYSDNTAKMNVAILFPKELLNTYNTSIADLKKELDKNGLKDWQYQELNETNNGIKYLGFELTAPKKFTETLLTFYKADNSTATVTFDLNKVNNSLNISELKDIDFNTLSDLESMGLELNLNISMPGTIKDTTFGKIKKDQVIINLVDLLKQDDISKIVITSSKNNQFFPLNFLIIISLLVILYLILRKSK